MTNRFYPIRQLIFFFLEMTSSAAKPEQKDIKLKEDEELIQLNSSKYLQDKRYGRNHITLFLLSFLSVPST